LAAGKASVTIRLARREDIGALEALIALSVETLQAAHYSAHQRAAALGTVFGVDSQLIDDGTYFLVEIGGEIVGCGGWSRRKTPFGSDHVAGKDDALLDPQADAARIRAFFVHPNWARKGIGSAILRTCENAAAEAGFTRLMLVATLPGVPLYAARGYASGESFSVPLANGDELPVLAMHKCIDNVPQMPGAS
jgi:N-acetylglutamate synthase-like GNAT family acetyltransferase